MKRSEHHPRDQILDAAEAAFANAGFEGASMRQIVQEAGVNLATVYYHFGSKEGLMAAVFQRRFEPLRNEHRELLKQLEQEAGGKPLPIERILEAMLTPPLRLASSATRQSRAVLRLIGRIVNEPNPQTQQLLRTQHHKIREAYLAAMRRSVPHLPEADLQWRFEFVWGALAFVLCNPGKLETMTGGLCNPADTQTVLKQMIRFFAAGFQAPASACKPPKTH